MKGPKNARTYAWMDEHLRPALLGRLCQRVDLKMETRHPIEALFGSEFPVICNHCRVVV